VAEPVEGDARMLVELDEDDRAVDAVVERLVTGGAAQPGEPRLAEMGISAAMPEYQPNRRGPPGISERDTGRRGIEPVPD
jgi:hypothetical protein